MTTWRGPSLDLIELRCHVTPLEWQRISRALALTNTPRAEALHRLITRWAQVVLDTQTVTGASTPPRASDRAGPEPPAEGG